MSSESQSSQQSIESILQWYVDESQKILYQTMQEQQRDQSDQVKTQIETLTDSTK